MLAKKEFECCLTDIPVNFVFSLVCMYIAPQQCLVEPFLRLVDILCQIINSKFKNILNVDDFNIDVLNKYKTLNSSVDILNSYD